MSREQVGVKKVGVKKASWLPLASSRMKDLLSQNILGPGLRSQ